MSDDAAKRENQRITEHRFRLLRELAERRGREKRTGDRAMTDELKPCPFCGKPPKVCPDTSYGTATVFCPDENECPISPLADADLIAGETLQTAIAGWNTRAPIEQLSRPAAQIRDAALTEAAEVAKRYHLGSIIAQEIAAAILALRSKGDNNGPS